MKLRRAVSRLLSLGTKNRVLGKNLVLAMLCLFCLGLATVLARYNLTARLEQVRRNDKVRSARSLQRWLLGRREVSAVQVSDSHPEVDGLVERPLWSEMSELKGFEPRSSRHPPRA